MAVVAPTNNYDSDNSNETVDYDYESDAEQPMAMFLTVDSGSLAVTNGSSAALKEQEHEESGTGSEDGEDVTDVHDNDSIQKTDSSLMSHFQDDSSNPKNLVLDNDFESSEQSPSFVKVDGGDIDAVDDDDDVEGGSNFSDGDALKDTEKDGNNTFPTTRLESPGNKMKNKTDFLRIQYVNKEKSVLAQYLNSTSNSLNEDKFSNKFTLKTTFKQEKPFDIEDEKVPESSGIPKNTENDENLKRMEFQSDVASVKDSANLPPSDNQFHDFSENQENFGFGMYSNETLTSTTGNYLSKEISQDLGDLTQYPEKANLTASMYKNDVLVDELRKQHALPESSHAMIAQFLENEVQTAMKRAVLKKFLPMQIGESDISQPDTSSTVDGSGQDPQEEFGEPKTPEMIDCAFVVNGKTLRPCNVCGKVFKTTKELRIHFRTHTNEKPFVCDICGKAFRQRAHLASHEKIHSGEKPFTCELCHTSFTENSSLKRHLRRHFGIKPFRCELCGENFITSTLLKSHNRRKHEEKKYEYRCDICPKIYSCKESLNKHKRSHDPETRISCEKCGLVCLTMGHLRRHLLVHERQEAAATTSTPKTKTKPFECGSCGKTYTMKSHLERHLLNSCGKEPNKCKECDIAFETRYAYRQHRAEMHHQAYTKLRPHKCPMCDMQFRFERSCEAHVAKVHTKIKPFECDVCFKKFGRRSKLANHRQGHFSRDFKCGECEKTYPSARGLKDHMAKKHLNQEKVKVEAFCEICQKIFCDKTVLKEHRRTQHAEVVEKFVCAVCGSAFSRKHSLTRHMQVHDENKPRLVVGSCDICGKAFYTKYGLTEHKRIIHAIIKEEDKFTCPGCGKKYIRKHSMKRHIKRTSCKNSPGYLAMMRGMDVDTSKDSTMNDSTEEDDELEDSHQGLAHSSSDMDGDTAAKKLAAVNDEESNFTENMSETEREEELFNLSNVGLLPESDDEMMGNSEDEDSDKSDNSDDGSDTDMDVDSEDTSDEEHAGEGDTAVDDVREHNSMGDY